MYHMHTQYTYINPPRPIGVAHLRAHNTQNTPNKHTHSKWDFSFLGGVLFAGLWILLIWGIINVIWGFEEGRVYSLIGAVIFSLYIIFDTWLLSQKLPYDEWVLGAISLYLDIANLVIFILQLLAEAQQRERQRQQQQG